MKISSFRGNKLQKVLKLFIFSSCLWMGVSPTKLLKCPLDGLLHFSTTSTMIFLKILHNNNNSFKLREILPLLISSHSALIKIFGIFIHKIKKYQAVLYKLSFTGSKTCLDVCFWKVIKLSPEQHSFAHNFLGIRDSFLCDWLEGRGQGNKNGSRIWTQVLKILRSILRHLSHHRWPFLTLRIFAWLGSDTSERWSKSSWP